MHGREDTHEQLHEPAVGGADDVDDGFMFARCGVKNLRSEGLVLQGGGRVEARCVAGGWTAMRPCK